jgi:hypothetical protein
MDCVYSGINRLHHTAPIFPYAYFQTVTKNSTLTDRKRIAFVVVVVVVCKQLIHAHHLDPIGRALENLDHIRLAAVVVMKDSRVSRLTLR